ncbi:hypothetical protein CY34DRAFT_811226 [Suillus luteus UH-Slu-Lm8-n1]|uniref:Uncharacterized protein n=1 Tax=Suillus luteus UH-Slu-Lm8-n1 TaxID=930992 RepID=A0A0D0A4J9_9AGAM|nr:hypothetical protein CY34DRAFT_811226 [Suillus luteus UH-Slu-Lm8-n1]
MMDKRLVLLQSKMMMMASSESRSFPLKTIAAGFGKQLHNLPVGDTRCHTHTLTTNFQFGDTLRGLHTGKLLGKVR